MENNDEIRSIIRNFISGVFGGISTCLICSPFDVIKTRSQVGNYNNVNINQVIYNIYKKENFKGFYKGASGSFIAIPLFWGCYFPLYNKTKEYFNSSVSGFIASNIASFISNPFWVVRTRLQTLYFYNNRDYRGNFDTLFKIYKQEGILSWYKGYTLTFIGNIQFLISMPIYEKIKKETNNDYYGIILASALSKTIAGGIMYPHDVIRSIIRNDINNKTVLNTITKLYNENGIKGFYRGFGIYLIRGIPFSISIFLSYEFNKNYLKLII